VTELEVEKRVQTKKVGRKGAEKLDREIGEGWSITGPRRVERNDLELKQEGGGDQKKKGTNFLGRSRVRA